LVRSLNSLKTHDDEGTGQAGPPTRKLAIFYFIFVINRLDII